jgi:succinoglycan biosynthesis protein ExoO
MAVDVSIIIPVWNGAAFVGDAVRSALAQRGVDVEVIVVDDCSTDNTVAIVRAIGDRRITVIEREKNGGPGAARNIGFDAATGTWIAVLDADDAMEPLRLQKLLQSTGSRDADILADDLLMVPQGKAMFTADRLPREGILRLPLLLASDRIFAARWSFGYLKPLFGRDFLREHRLRYPTDIAIGEDFIFLAECLSAGGRMRIVAEPLYRYSIRPGSISARTGLNHVEAMLSAQAKLLERRPAPGIAIRAFDARRRSLERGLAYLLIIDDLKRRDIRSALLRAARHPRASLLLRLPLLARLRRLVSPYRQ